MKKISMFAAMLVLLTSLSGCAGGESSTIDTAISVGNAVSVDEDGACGSSVSYDCLYLTVNIDNYGDQDFDTNILYWSAIGEDGGVYPATFVEGAAAILGGYATDIELYFEISTGITVNEIRYELSNKDPLSAVVPTYEHYLSFNVSISAEYYMVGYTGPGLCGSADDSLCHMIDVTVENSGLLDFSTNMFYWEGTGSDGLSYSASMVEAADGIPGSSTGQVYVYFDVVYPIFITSVHWEDFSHSVSNIEVLLPRGCTDEDAYNYDPLAFEDDGSCLTAHKIGFLNPITGPLEPNAPVFSWAANEAIKDLNEMYPHHPFELVEADSGCDGAVAGPSAQTLVESGVLGVVGAACSGASMAANGVLSAAGIPMISYASTNPFLSEASAYPMFYRTVPSDAIQGPAAAAMMIDAGVASGSLAILHMNNDYGAGLGDSVSDAWIDAGNYLCAKYAYEPIQVDFADLASWIVEDMGCTTVYLASYQQDAGYILDALYNAGWQGQVFGGDGPSGMGLYSHVVYDSDIAGMQVTQPRAGVSYGNFSAYYDENAPSGGIKAYDLTTYDSIMIMGMAIMLDGRSVDQSIGIIGTNYQGASGLINFQSNGDITGPGYDICEFDGLEDGINDYSCPRYWTFENGIQSY